MKVIFVAGDKGIKEVKLALRAKNTPGLEWELLSEKKHHELEKLIGNWMESFAKQQQPDVSLPISLEGVPPYSLRVLSILREIPFGVSLTYKQLAEITGNPRGARAVGNACARNPCPLIIPCHRVLAQSGLGGFSCGLEFKESLLAFESIDY